MLAKTGKSRKKDSRKKDSRKKLHYLDVTKQLHCDKDDNNVGFTQMETIKSDVTHAVT